MKVYGSQLLAIFLAQSAIMAPASVLYVNVNGTNAVSPYSDWSIAATNIQDAIDAANPGDQVVVTNGVYQIGGSLVSGVSNRVAVTKRLSVQSVAGPEVTVISGSGAVRCVYLTNEAMLAGFTLTNGAASDGGGLWCASASAVASNCVLTGSSASSTAGGASGGTLRNCIITNNSASNPGTYGGGAHHSTLMDCVLTRNSANVGGGAYMAVLTNCAIRANSAVNLGGGTASCTAQGCILSSNSAPTGGGAYFGTFYSCTFSNNAATSGGSGGGAHGSTLYNCLLTGNTANLGAGTSYGTIIGCTLWSNRATAGGGGTWQGTVSNCVIGGNSANTGGGGFNSILSHCLMVSNTAFGNGGGGYGGTIDNCAVLGNSAQNGGGYYALSGLSNCTVVANAASASCGGVYGSGVGAMNNCIIYYNAAPSASNYSGIKLNYCCTTPILSGDTTCFTNAPRLMDLAGTNLHLQADSPCINAGNNSYLTTATDLEGNPRVVAGTVDIGAYEFPSPASVLSYAWAQRFGLPTDGTADFADTDGDRMNNWQEWRCGTDPTNALSVLMMLAPSNSVTGLKVPWQSVSGVTYYLQRSTNLAAQPAFSTIQSNIAGKGGTTTLTDTYATGAGPFFYRLGVQ